MLTLAAASNNTSTAPSYRNGARSRYLEFHGVWDILNPHAARLFTAGFVGTNAAGLACRTEHRRLVERASMLFGLAVVSCLVVVTGGADEPLLFLFLVPAFTYGFRSEPRSAYPSTAVNSVALAVISAASPGDGLSVPRVLGPAVVAGVMWIEGVLWPWW